MKQQSGIGEQPGGEKLTLFREVGTGRIARSYVRSEEGLISRNTVLAAKVMT